MGPREPCKARRISGPQGNSIATDTEAALPGSVGFGDPALVASRLHPSICSNLLSLKRVSLCSLLSAHVALLSALERVGFVSLPAPSFMVPIPSSRMTLTVPAQTRESDQADRVTQLSEFVRAVITKHRKLGGSTREIHCLMVLGARSLRSRCLHD